MPYDVTTVIKRPIITERSTLLKEQHKYVFVVDKKATKGQIKEAVQAAFKVNVLAINTAQMVGKMRRRMGPKGGYTSNWKKAIVTIKPGQDIKFAEPS